MEKSYVVVKTLQGLLRGKKAHSRAGAAFYSFQGIPYAQPPVGSLRFKAPRPAEAWEGVRDALKEGPVAPHIDDFLTTDFSGHEDCLFLNVYTPQLPETNQREAMPVMLWIHGGGFYVGSGNSDFYGPDYLVTQNVVLVTINYRLGALGFLSTGDAVIPGNNGLKDQVMALRWVQENISRFGGDPSNVTIFGESAGGACAHMHMLSSMSKGLFHKVIAQSGTICNPWAFEEPSVARERAFRFGKALGCKADNSEDLLQELCRLSPKDLVEGMNTSLTYEEKHPLPLYFRPTSDVEADDIFLPGNPVNLLRQGKFESVPFLTGVTSHEGMFVLKDAVLYPEWFATFEKSFKIPFPHGLEKSGRYQEIVSQVRELYFGSSAVSKETWKEFVDMYSDTWFSSPASRAVKEHAKHSTSPIYFYRFAFDGVLGYADLWVGEARFPGVCHADELGYLFQSITNTDKDFDSGDDNMKMIKKMVGMWTNFARTGDPTPKGDLCWDPATATKLNYLNIDKVVSMRSNMDEERMRFWENVYNN